MPVILATLETGEAADQEDHGTKSAQEIVNTQHENGLAGWLK
jgi:hypothetical protein